MSLAGRTSAAHFALVTTSPLRSLLLGPRMQPKDTTTNEAFKGFTNTACPFLPCHTGVRGQFNCLFCYCPLIAYRCPGPYKVFTDRNGIRRKDCSDCTLPHNGYGGAWNFIQKWLERPVVWDGHEQTRRYQMKPPRTRS